MSLSHNIPAIGYVPPIEDCRVPLGAVLIEFKQCENCPCVFIRPKSTQKRRVEIKHDWWGGSSVVLADTGLKFCPACRGQKLMPPTDEEVYRDITEQASLPGRFAKSQRIHYDDSLRPKTSSHQLTTLPIPPRGKRGHLGDWLPRVAKALMERGPLTSIQLAEISGHRGAPAIVVVFCREKGLNVIEVGHVWPRRSCMGPCPKLYNLSYER